MTSLSPLEGRHMGRWKSKCYISDMKCFFLPRRLLFLFALFSVLSIYSFLLDCPTFSSLLFTKCRMREGETSHSTPPHSAEAPTVHHPNEVCDPGGKLCYCSDLQSFVATRKLQIILNIPIDVLLKLPSWHLKKPRENVSFHPNKIRRWGKSVGLNTLTD